jgi:putative endonuclease
MANKRNGVIYIGVTSNLLKGVYEHKYAQSKDLQKSMIVKILSIMS